MKSKPFTSFDEALAYIQKAGKIKYFGRIGDNHEIALYNLYIGNRVYQLSLRDDGLLTVLHERYKHKDE